MKGNYLSILVFLFLFYINGNSHKHNGLNSIAKCSFEGDWSSKNFSKAESLEIHIHCINDSIKGCFCATMNYGRLLDCDPDDSSEVGIRGIVSSPNTAIIKIQNEADSVGKGKLTLLNKNTIKWELLKSSGGISNIPDKIILYRIEKLK